MKLSNQSIGALMMALQKSLMEQSDIVPMLKEMNLQLDPEYQSQSTLVVTNPPVVSLDGITVSDTEEVLTMEEE